MEKSLAPTGIRTPDHPVHGTVTVPTTLPWLQIIVVVYWTIFWEQTLYCWMTG